MRVHVRKAEGVNGGRGSHALYFKTRNVRLYSEESQAHALVIQGHKTLFTKRSSAHTSPSLPCSLTHSLPHSLPRSLTHSLPHSLPRSLTHSLTQLFNPLNTHSYRYLM